MRGNYVNYGKYSILAKGPDLETMDYRDIAVIGGDRRTLHMASALLRDGCRVICYGTLEFPAGEKDAFRQTPPPREAASLKEALTSAGCVVCGIPMEKEGYLCCRERIPVSELQRNLRKKQKLFGGLISEELRHHCEEREIECHDFLKDEPLTLFNAVATAEGAILEALSHKERLLHQSSCLVLGYGRCGSLIAEKLRGLCALVSVTDRSETKLALAAAKGFSVFPLASLAENVSRFEYLFNTIPACYLGAACLPEVRRDSLIIDVASGRTGVDYDVAKELSLTALFCPGLPGKYAAGSCGERLAKFVLQTIN